MEAAWTDLHKWYFAGMDITQTAGWFPYELDPAAGMDSADITNQFIVFGLKAGLVGVGLAITTFVFAFKGLGSAMALARRHKSLRQSEFLLWGLGVALFVHVVSWLGVSYFDQSWVIWLAHVAAVSASVQSYKIRERQRSLEPAHNSLDEDERISFADAYAT